MTNHLRQNDLIVSLVTAVQATTRTLALDKGRSGLIVLLLAFAGLLTGADASAQDWAEKMFTTKSHDFRTVGRGTKAEYRFKFENLYEEDVHVAALRTSCGCTTPTLTKDTLSSRETGAVVATLNTDSFIGQKAATITVVFDKPYFAEVQLKVQGYIRTDITFDPPEVSFGDLAGGETREQEIVISHRGDSDWRITDVRSHCTQLLVRLDPPEISPGLVRYRMTVELKDSMPEGEIREQLTLVSNDAAFPTIEMLVGGRVRPAVTISPAAANLGSALPGETVKVRLLVRAAEPFAIQDIRCADPRFSFEVQEGKKSLHWVNLLFAAGQSTGSVDEKIEIVTDLPGEKSAECLVTGSIAAR